MLGGVARLAGPMLKAFGKGLAGQGVASLGHLKNGVSVATQVPKALQVANTAGRIVDSPIGNYALNTVSDAAFGALWGEDPVKAFQRSAVANVGGTIGQKVIGAGLDKIGVNRGMQEFLGGTFINPLSYSLTEMAAMKVAPGFYGMDANGNYIGDDPQQPQQQAMSIAQLNPEQQQAMAYQQMAMAAQNPPGLSPIDRQAAQADFYFDQRDKQARAQQALAKQTYRRALESQFAGVGGGAGYDMLPAGIPSLDQQNQMYGGMR